MQEEPVSCRGINGSITLSRGRMTITGLDSDQPQDVEFGDVSSVVVQRKSVVPFITSMIVAIVALAVANFNLLWFLIDLYRWRMFITPVALPIAILSAIAIVLRVVFVNVTVRSRRGTLRVRLVPSRSAQRLARQFSEIYAGG